MLNKNIILFIDDEKICHTLVELIIPNFTQYKLISAFNGAQAIELAKRYANNIALVLSDILLPDINGYEIFARLKEDPRLQEAPFIFQSGLDSQEEELKKHITEDVKLLYKPYTQSDLLKVINEALNIN